MFGESISAGPLSIPVWLVAAAVAVGVTTVIQRTALRASSPLWRITNDAFVTAAVVGFLVWKLTPLITRFDEITAAPARLLYYPGGTPGVAAGVLLASGACLLSVRRGLRRSDEARATMHSAPGAAAVGALLPVGVVAVALAAVALLPGTGDAGGQSTGPGSVDFDWLPGYEATVRDNLPTVVTVWATWCGPCTAQMPEIDRFAAEHGAAVNLVALNLTATEESPSTVRSYMEERGLDFPVALDPSGSLAAVYAVSSTPTTIVFDASGEEIARRVGAVNADWFARRVLPLGR